MGKIPRFISAIQVCGLILTAALARAEPPPEGTRARLLLSADEAMRDGRFADARDAFLAVWEATSERDAACNVGRLSFRIGDMPRGVEFLELCVSTAPEGTEDTRDARAELAQARSKVTELRVRAPRRTEVLIDGTPRGRAPLVVYVPPGSHTIGGRGPGGSEAEVLVSATPGKTQVVELKPTPPAGRVNGWVVAGGTVGSAALVGLGVVLTLTANRTEGAGDANLPGGNGCITIAAAHCRDADRAYATMATMRGVALVGFIAGATLATSTLAYTFYPRRRGSMSARVGASGVLVEGAW